MMDARSESGEIGELPFGEFKNVRMEFQRRGAAPIEAIRDVSFELGHGELVSLLGPSGCGKTTFLRIAAGLLRATSGNVTVKGVEVTKPHDDFGFVFQSPNLMPWRNVLGNVLFPLEILKIRDSGARKRAMELLSTVGLGGFEKAMPSELSGGMQQRAALCRALIHEPTLLLMDEPFGALDELTRMEMNDLLLKIRETNNATVLFVTHSISEAIYLSDRVLVFSERPAVIADSINIEFGYPREIEVRYTEQFVEYEHRAGKALGISR